MKFSRSCPLEASGKPVPSIEIQMRDLVIDVPDTGGVVVPIRVTAAEGNSGGMGGLFVGQISGQIDRVDGPEIWPSDYRPAPGRGSYGAGGSPEATHPLGAPDPLR